MRWSAAVVVAFSLLLVTRPAPAETAGLDHWVLALSWSPTWCAGKAGDKDAEQCRTGKKHAFVVHGLWPQFSRGDRPKACAVGAGVPREVAEKALPLMPSRRLIDHEWEKHGACAGLSPADYFGKTRAAYDRVKIPAPLKAADKPQSLTVQQVEKLFADANPGLGPDAIAVTCRGDKAAEVRICLDKDLKFRDCRGSVRDRCRGEARFEPAR